MRKILISLCCLSISFAAMAQESSQSTESTVRDQRLTKNGYRFLPVAGDFAIGIEANPFFDYLGNMFNNSSSNPSPFATGYKGAIYGKYFLESNRAIRAKLNLDLNNERIDGVVPNQGALQTNPNATGVDEMKRGITVVELLVGYEFRRGHGRVQGFYGGEVGLGFGSGKDKYTYANPITETNQQPITSDFAIGVPGYSALAERTVEQKYGNAFNATVAGFVGVEFFFAPQISMGAEFNLAFRYGSIGQGEKTTEKWDVPSNKVIQNSSRAYGNGGFDYPNGKFGLYTEPTGSIFFMFHF